VTHGGPATDTLRWGDTDHRPINKTGPAEVVAFQSRQLVNAHWRWPLTWCVVTSIQPQMAAGEAGTFTVSIAFNVGLGQANSGFAIPFALTAAGLYAPVFDQRFIPAQDLQINAFIVGTSTIAAQENIQISVWVAPMTEPHAMTHILERMGGDPPRGEHSWMGPGFTPEPLEYRR
jgi:hypothetical protein